MFHRRFGEWLSYAVQTRASEDESGRWGALPPVGTQPGRFRARFSDGWGDEGLVITIFVRDSGVAGVKVTTGARLAYATSA